MRAASPPDPTAVPEPAPGATKLDPWSAMGVYVGPRSMGVRDSILLTRALLTDGRMGAPPAWVLK